MVIDSSAKVPEPVNISKLKRIKQHIRTTRTYSITSDRLTSKMYYPMQKITRDSLYVMFTIICVFGSVHQVVYILCDAMDKNSAPTTKSSTSDKFKQMPNIVIFREYR